MVVRCSKGFKRDWKEREVIKKKKGGQVSVTWIVILYLKMWDKCLYKLRDNGRMVWNNIFSDKIC